MDYQGEDGPIPQSPILLMQQVVRRLIGPQIRLCARAQRMSELRGGASSTSLAMTRVGPSWQRMIIALPAAVVILDARIAGVYLARRRRRVMGVKREHTHKIQSIYVDRVT